MEYAFRHRLFVGNYDGWRNLFARKYLFEGDARVQIIDNGIILPPVRDPKSNPQFPNFLGGVCDQNLNFIGGYFRSKFDPNAGVSLVRGAYYTKTVQRINEEVIFGGPLPPHFGHFIVEGMARFWYLIQNPQDKRNIIFFWGAPNWLISFFKLINIDLHRVRFINYPTLFNKVILPDQSVFPIDGYYKQHRLAYNYITDHLPPDIEKPLPKSLKLLSKESDRNAGLWI